MINSGREWDWMDNNNNTDPNKIFIGDAEIYNNIMNKFICTTIYVLTFKRVCLGWCDKKQKR